MLARRLAFSYGTRAWTLLGGATGSEDLGQRLVGDLHALELEYLRAHEWASTADDILWRRTKLGLKATPAEIQALRGALGAGESAEKLAG
jgi:glycerol-3-phosphate dehydrogenase